MPRLSILIAYEGNATALETTLVSVLEHRPLDCEILVAHDGSYTDPYDLSDEVRFVTLPPGTRLDQGLAAATLQSQGLVLHLLGAGAQVDTDWTEAAIDRLQDKEIGMVCPVLVDAANTRRVLAAGVRQSWGGARKVVRPRMSAITKGKKTAIEGPSRQAAFYRREDVLAVGGWPTAVGPDLADVDLAGSLLRTGLRSVIEPEAVICLPGKPQRTTTSAFQRGYFAERLYWRHAKDRGLKRTLAAHAGHCLVTTFGSLPLGWLPAIGGRTWGLIRAVLAKPHEPQVHPQYATPAPNAPVQVESLDPAYAKAA